MDKRLLDLYLMLLVYDFYVLKAESYLYLDTWPHVMVTLKKRRKDVTCSIIVSEPQEDLRSCDF